MENPYEQMDDLGVSHIFGNTQMKGTKKSIWSHINFQ